MSKAYIKVTAKIKAEIINDYQSGIGQKEIAEKFAFSKSTVARALEGVKKVKPLRRKKTVEKPKAEKIQNASRHLEIKKLWLDGYSKSKICQKLGMGYTTVDKAIIAMGIENDQEKAKMKAIDRISGTIKVRLDHKTEVYFPHCDNLEERILQKKIQLGIIKE